jgi:hypothetical protein
MWLALVDETRIARDHEQPLDARQTRNDVFDHPVGEILLLGVAAHVLERQHRDGRLVGQREASGLGRRGGLRLGGDADLQGIGADRLGDVLELG